MAELLLDRGQQHIIESVQLAEGSFFDDIYPRVVSFLRSSGLDLPINLKTVAEPVGWRESLWHRWDFPDCPAPSYIEGIVDGEDPTPILMREIEEADREVIKIDLEPSSYKGELISASMEIGLYRVIGVAVDIGNFSMAEAVITRLRRLGQRNGGDMSMVAESLAYLGVAEARKALSESSVS